MSLILDTDHCVAILRGRLNIDEVVPPDTTLFISATTVGELVYGAYKSARPEHNLDQVKRLVSAVQVLPLDADCAFILGKVKHQLRSQGTPIGEPDLEIASIALFHELPLVTHNQRHFNRVSGLILQDWL